MRGYTTHALHFVITLLVVIGAISCDGSGAKSNSGDDVQVPEDAVSISLTPDDGGKLASDDGSMTVEFPAGAVDEETTVWIRRLPAEEIPSDLPGPLIPEGVVWEIGPTDLALGEPASLTFAFSPEDLPDSIPGQVAPIIYLVHRDGAEETSQVDTPRILADYLEEEIIISGEAGSLGLFFVPHLINGHFALEHLEGTAFEASLALDGPLEGTCEDCGFTVEQIYIEGFGYDPIGINPYESMIEAEVRPGDTLTQPLNFYFFDPEEGSAKKEVGGLGIGGNSTLGSAHGLSIWYFTNHIGVELMVGASLTGVTDSPSEDNAMLARFGELWMGLSGAPASATNAAATKAFLAPEGRRTHHSSPNYDDNFLFDQYIMPEVFFTEFIMLDGTIDLASQPMHCLEDGPQPVFCPSGDPAFPEGGAWVFGLQLGGSFPTDPSGYQYQFSFVLQTTEDESDDYQAGPGYPNDWWASGDLIYSLSNSSVGGDYQVGAVTGPALQPVSTAARFMVYEEMLILYVPESEITELHSMRASSFRHNGDWGMSSEWSGAYIPQSWTTSGLLGQSGFTFYF